MVLEELKELKELKVLKVLEVRGTQPRRWYVLEALAGVLLARFLSLHCSQHRRVLVIALVEFLVLAREVVLSQALQGLQVL
jgi:hypothetical protein